MQRVGSRARGKRTDDGMTERLDGGVEVGGSLDTFGEQDWTGELRTPVPGGSLTAQQANEGLPHIIGVPKARHVTLQLGPCWEALCLMRASRRGQKLANASLTGKGHLLDDPPIWGRGCCVITCQQRSEGRSSHHD
jgi:hypothetical protein